MKIYNLQRRLTGANGSSLLAPILTASSEEVAKHFEQEELKWLEGIAQCHIVKETPQGARLVMPVANFLQRLGVHGCFTVIQSDEVRDTTLVKVASPLLAPNGQRLS